MKNILIALILLSSVCFCDVLSTDGKIRFDIQMDGQPEMTLNSTGLGILTLPSSNLHVNGNAIISEQLFVGGSSGSSNLNVNGTIWYGLQTVSANATLGDSSVVLVDSSSDNITLTLPYAGNVSGRIYNIKKTSLLNSVWITGAGNLIDDTSPIELANSTTTLSSVKVMSNGSQWYIIESKDLSATVAADNLVGWWKFDESVGSVVVDSSGQNNDGVINGADFSDAGKFGYALDFNGSSDFISIATGNGVPIDNEPYTISTWIKSDSSGSRGIIGWGNYGSFNQVNAFRLHETNKLLNYWWANDLTATSGDLTGNWYHVVAKFDGVTREIIVNNESKGTDTPVGHIVPNTNNFRIGSTNGGEYFNGLIDDVRVYNRALTLAEIQALYNQGQ
jgi:hypothetical protein